MKRLMVSIFCWGIFLTVLVEPAGARPKILLLSHFNEGLDADISTGDKTSGGRDAQITSGGRGYPFKNSLPLPEALDLTAESGNFCANLSYALKNNIDLEQGTVGFWVKFKREIAQMFKGTRVLFGMWIGPPGEQGYPKHRFWAYKVADSTEIRAHFSDEYQSSNWVCKGDISHWKANEWHHIFITWDAVSEKKRIKLYLDGEYVAECGPYYPLSTPPERFGLGHPWIGYRSEAYFDEFVIYDTPLTDEEVEEDYKWMVKGNELPYGITKKAVVQKVSETKEVKKEAVQEKPVFEEQKKEIKKAKALYIDKPLQIDGQLDEEAWSVASPITPFLLKDGKEPEASSKAYLLYNRSYLYVGFRFEEPHMDKLHCSYTQRDHNTWNDDCIEVFLDTKESPQTKFHFILNAANGIYDARITDKTYNANTKSAIYKGKNFWSGELAVPFNDLGSLPLLGGEWGINIARERYAGTKENSCWIGGAAYFNPAEMPGVLLFGEGATSNKITLVKVVNPGQLFFGYNIFTAQITNKTTDLLSLCSRIEVTSNKGLSLRKSEQDFTIRPDQVHSLNLPYTLLSDEDANVIFSIVQTDNKNVVFIGKYQIKDIPFFRFSSSQLKKLIPSYQRINETLSPAHFISKEMRSVLEKTETQISLFDNEVSSCIKERKNISTQSWLSLKEGLEEFDNWEKNHRIMYWERGPWLKVQPADLPTKVTRTTEIRAQLAKGELESASFMITNLLCLEGLNIRIMPGDLKDSSGKVFSKDRIRIREVVLVSTMSKELVANPLVGNEANIFFIPAGESKQIWITIDARGAEAGDYSGEITIKPLNLISGEIDSLIKLPLQVKIWDFELPPTGKNPLNVFIWTGGDLPEPDRLTVVKDLDEHRVNVVPLSKNRSGWMRGLEDQTKRTEPTMQWWQKGIWDWKVKVDYNYNFDDPFIKEAKSRGLKLLMGFVTPKTPQFISGLVQNLKELGFSHDELYVHAGPDEFQEKDVPMMIERGKIYRQLDPNVKYGPTVTTYGPRAPGAESIKRLTPYMDFWMVSFGQFYPQTEQSKEKLRFFQDTGLKVWVYSCSIWMNTLSLIDYYRLNPWKVWKLGLDGTGFWTYHTWQGDSWDPFDKERYTRYGDNGMVYEGGRNDVVSSKHWEAFREGVEDYCYLYLLKQAIEKADKRGKDTKEFKQLLSNSVDDVLNNPNLAILENYRVKIAAAIIGLEKK